MRHHEAMYVHNMWHTRTYVWVSVCARVCACDQVCANVCACVISEIKHPFQDFCLVISHILYTGRFTLIFAMWDYLCLFLRVGDVAHSRACDRVNKSRL